MLAFASFTAQATHFRGGEIYYKSDTTAARNPLRYFFTLVTYTVAPPSFEDLEATLYFGDCTSQRVARDSRTLLASGPVGTFRNTYRFEHVFSGPGTFSVSFSSENRNGGIVNLSNSVAQTFYLQSTLTVDPFLGVNRSPVFQAPPIDVAVRNQPYVHNPLGYDADGDSLSYKMIIPMGIGEQNACGTPLGRNAALHQGLENFLGRTDPSKPSGYTMDRTTGQLTWNTPGVLGEYAVALLVEEWRDGRLIGQVIRDRQLYVREDTNRPPVLTIPRDTCAVAGTLWRDTVRARDPDKNNVVMFASGGMFPQATFPRLNDTTNVFSWQTSCQDVQRTPFLVTFQAEDFPSSGNNLKDVQTWRITVVGPPPVLVSAVSQSSNGIRVSWNPYPCGSVKLIHIYRKVNTSAFVPDACTPGIPASAGYTLVASVPPTANSYLDNAQGLAANQRYCYRIYAEFDGSRGGNSVASNEVCTSSLTGISDDLKQQISFYPNPAPALLTVKAPPGLRLQEVQVFNALGQQAALLTPVKSAEGWDLDVRSLANGLYLLHLPTSQGTLVQRVVIKR